MSISTVCIHQRLKERKQLKLILAGSLIGSSLLHIAICYSANYWKKNARSTDPEPIELIIVEAPKPMEKPKAIAKPRAVKLKPSKIKIVKIQKLTPAIEPEIVKQKVVKNLPPPVPEKPIPIAPQSKPLPDPEPEPPNQPKPEPIKPQELKLTSRKPIKPQPNRSTRSSTTKVRRTPQRSNSDRTRRINPSKNSPIRTANTTATRRRNQTIARSSSGSNRDFPNNLDNTNNPGSTPRGGDGGNENPGNVAKNRTVTRNNSSSGSLQRSANSRNFRNNLDDINTPSSGGNSSNENPGSAPKNRPIARNNLGGGSLQRSGGNRDFRNNLGGNNSSSTPDGGNVENGNPGTVAGNRPIARNNLGGGSLQRSGGNRDFRNNLGSGNNPSSTPDGGNVENENPGTVAGNRPIARNNSSSGSLQRSGNSRNFRNNLGSGNSNEGGEESNNSGNGEEPGNIAANRPPSGDRGSSGEAFTQIEVTCIRNCQPKYPRGLKKIQARPVVRIEMTADGKPISASIVTSSGYPELDEAVRQMAMKMEFSPPGRSGTLRLKFHLPRG
jgi:TonB family protein